MCFNVRGSEVEWQSEQEKKESKSIYHSEKEDSYIPIVPKTIEGPEILEKGEKTQDSKKIENSKVVPEIPKDHSSSEAKSKDTEKR
ncbi:hypothetical protein NQ314_000031 [Rhamnusium bicolor]|uniref:Uncharacterized protein n=1 Tax=Rhamnusium bicolor TaxID=1586634 RepID=A0AAV8ZWI2_9CUCU|nr:hypothetical protein NQ314_000031 [Rhamnusium bicolor]